MIQVKGTSYFDQPLMRGDIIKTTFGFWAVVRSVRKTGDEDHEYSYSYIQGYNSNQEVLSAPFIHRKEIVVAFESARMSDIREEYPEYFI